LHRLEQRALDRVTQLPTHAACLGVGIAEILDG
jgi:hypothetical protein